MQDIYTQCQMPLIEKSEDQLDLKMTWSQVKELHDEVLFYVGGHTHNHAILSHLDNDNLNYEIETSLNLLKEKAEILTHHYSYPEGQKEHYSDEAIYVLIQNGIKCCPTAEYSLNKAGDSLFHLKRTMVI